MKHTAALNSLPVPQDVGQLERDVLQAVGQDLLREVGEERPPLLARVRETLEAIIQN